MKLVIDVNCIISGLIKDSSTRRIIMDNEDGFFTPEHTLSKLTKYKEEICKKAGLNEAEYDTVLSMLFESIDIVPAEDYAFCMEKATQLLGQIDIEDVPFIALALAKHLGIWSNDLHFKRQTAVKVISTNELIEELKLLK